MRIYQEMEALRRRWDEEDAPIKLRPFQAPSPKQPEFFGRRAQQKFAALRNRTRLDEPADDQASILKVLANDRGLFRPFLYLHMLKACADGRSVSLGIKRLAALAECASPDASVNPETIGRYFQSVEKKFPNLRRGLLQRYRQPPSQSHS
jgi:hypothetical protein